MIALSPTAKAVAESSYGARVKYQGNVLLCSQHRTFAENLRTCLEALEHLTGIPVAIEEGIDLLDLDGLTIEAYRSS